MRKAGVANTWTGPGATIALNENLLCIPLQPHRPASCRSNWIVFIVGYWFRDLWRPSTAAMTFGSRIMLAAFSVNFDGPARQWLAHLSTRLCVAFRLSARDA